mmetsp:Transcript_23885/g.28887  ORF Transcript_23885/g.28887 Transcript_23885/m.28887 type:complete len:562 (+) Transcript_23885:357-2042(+)|eukprot:CAMPEP_0197861438 /NCGR_PEP_ID=MMETSP1438-20131217/37507_1 /TAXON_ID=1461541 /ORGANISM="Pterosperma sp., Strain CCMP1384" /LENGTH=561 /DNA_ID=CAMNT_0043478619 /DNA_START=341 /DNA_END=2026 /DNA_ORIENTATION=-
MYAFVPRAGALFFALLLCLAQVCSAVKVVELDATSLPKVVGKHKKLMLVEFYAPDCGHCQRLEPVLEEVAEQYAGRVTVVKVDSRSSSALNRQYGVKQTPTLLLFKRGEIIESATQDLQGYRTAATLGPFLENHIGPSCYNITSTAQLDTVVEQTGTIVVGVFDDLKAKGVSAFRSVARKLRSHIRFGIVTNPVVAQSVAETYEMADIPSVFVLKELDHVIEYDEEISNEETLEAFAEFNSFPLVGNFSVLTFYRYKYREAPQVLLFTDQWAPEETQKNHRLSVEAFKQVATMENDDKSFMTVGHQASEEDGRYLMIKSGLSFYKNYGLAVRGYDGEGHVAGNQLRYPFTEDDVRDTIQAFYNQQGDTQALPNGYRCVVSTNKQREEHYTPDILTEYDNYAQAEKERLRLSDDIIREVDEASFSRQLRKSYKDVMIIYVARWCSISNRMEEILHRMVRAGEFEDIEDELQFVKIDVVTTQAKDYKSLNYVPAIKYISARYKDFPNWYGGKYDDPDAIVNFVRAYHSMRHVEIPGEGPSPFSKKAETPEARAVADAADEIVF